jgi:hypothetical protein
VSVRTTVPSATRQIVTSLPCPAASKVPSGENVTE